MNKGLFAAWAIAAVATTWSFHADACEITWDTPADVGVTPCGTCVYTARFYRGADESPDSDPLAVTIQGVPQFGTITIQAQ
jgi:hypothetical protein